MTKRNPKPYVYLLPEEIENLRADWASGNFTRLDLMYKYKVSDRTLRNVINRRERFAEEESA
jgi:Mor family transcriptional regulator